MCSATDILFLADTDGDDVADVKEIVLEGFSLGGSTQLRVSHPTLGLDNWIDGNGKPMDPVSLKDYRGKVVYLYFFQDW